MRLAPKSGAKLFLEILLLRCSLENEWELVEYWSRCPYTLLSEFEKTALDEVRP